MHGLCVRALMCGGADAADKGSRLQRCTPVAQGAAATQKRRNPHFGIYTRTAPSPERASMHSARLQARRVRRALYTRAAQAPERARMHARTHLPLTALALALALPWAGANSCLANQYLAGATLSCKGGCFCTPTSGSTGFVRDDIMFALNFQYAINLDCEYVLYPDLPLSGNIVTLQFTHFMTEHNKDFVYMDICTTAECQSFIRLETLSGNGDSVTFATRFESTAAHPFLRLRFTTDGQTGNRGFIATWTASGDSVNTCSNCSADSSSPAGSVGGGACIDNCLANQYRPGATLSCKGACLCTPMSGVSGTIRDKENWDLAYAPGLNCEYLLYNDSPASGDTVTINFAKFRMSEPFDQVRVDICTTATCHTWTRLATLSGAAVSSLTEYASTTTRPFLRLNFVTGSIYPDNGFVAKWRVSGSNANTCLNCAANSTSSAASVMRAACKCNAGHTGADGGLCTVCGAGTYKNATGSGACVACPPDTYRADAGAAAGADCLQCPAFAAAPPGSAARARCTCRDGYAGAAGETCLACAAGKFGTSVYPTASLTCAVTAGCACTASASHTSGVITDGEGNYQANMKCDYILQHDAGVALQFSELETEGTYDFVYVDICTTAACTFAIRLASLTGSPSLLPQYTSNPTHPFLRVKFTSDGSTQRSGFIANWFSLGSVVNVCTDCPPDSASPEASFGAAACVACAEGTYQSSAEAGTCLACSFPGEQNCGPRRVRGNCTRTQDSVCAECADDCRAGEQPDAHGCGCTQCPSGFFKAAAGNHDCGPCGTSAGYNNCGFRIMRMACIRTRDTFCVACGTTPCPAGWQPDKNGCSCTRCASGFFKANADLLSCAACPPGTNQSATGATQCAACPPGTYQNATGAAQCAACPPGTRQSATGATQCAACPPGTYQNATGATQCVDCPPDTYRAAPGADCLRCPEHAASPPGSAASAACICRAGFTGAPGETCLACAGGKFKEADG